MELNKNLLFTYLDSIETPNLFSSYKIKKFPSLNEYAENYLANMNKPKENNEINNNSDENEDENEKENINDINSSAKALSNDISNNDTNIQTNQISKVIYKNDEGNDIENPYSNKLKARNNFTIEHLKQNFNKKSKKLNTLTKNNVSHITLTQNYNNTTKAKGEINNKICINITKNKKGLSELYKKISPSRKTKLNSPIFSAFRSGNSKSSFCSNIFKTNGFHNVEYLSLSKSVNSLNDYKSNSKSFLSEKVDFDINKKFTKINKKFSASLLAKNFLENYIYTDKNKYKNKNKKNKNRIQINFSESHTDDSYYPFISISNRYYTNKSNSQSIENYWKEKEIKKKIKMMEIRNEKIYKEISEIRDRPKINENSRKIADKLGYNSSLNVFERLSELSKNKIIFNERKINTKTGNNNFKLKLYKELNYQNYIERKKKGLKIEKDFKSLKQIENFNQNIIERILQEQENKKNKKKIKNINTIIQDKNDLNNSFNFENEKYKKEFSNNSKTENNNMKTKIIKPKIMHKKIKLKNKIIENNIRKPVIEKNVKLIKPINKIGKTTFNNKANNINIKNKGTIFSNYNSIKKITIKSNCLKNENKNKIINSKNNESKNNMINKYNSLQNIRYY